MIQRYFREHLSLHSQEANILIRQNIGPNYKKKITQVVVSALKEEVKGFEVGNNREKPTFYVVAKKRRHLSLGLRSFELVR